MSVPKPNLVVHRNFYPSTAPRAFNILVANGIINWQLYNLNTVFAEIEPLAIYTRRC